MLTLVITDVLIGLKAVSCVQEQRHWVVCSRCFMEALHLEYHLDEYTHDLVQGNP